MDIDKLQKGLNSLLEQKEEYDRDTSGLKITVSADAEGTFIYNLSTFGPHLAFFGQKREEEKDSPLENIKEYLYSTEISLLVLDRDSNKIWEGLSIKKGCWPIFINQSLKFSFENPGVYSFQIFLVPKMEKEPFIFLKDFREEHNIDDISNLFGALQKHYGNFPLTIKVSDFDGGFPFSVEPSLREPIKKALKSLGKEPSEFRTANEILSEFITENSKFRTILPSDSDYKRAEQSLSVNIIKEKESFPHIENKFSGKKF